MLLNDSVHSIGIQYIFIIIVFFFFVFFFFFFFCFKFPLNILCVNITKQKKKKNKKKKQKKKTKKQKQKKKKTKKTTYFVHFILHPTIKIHFKWNEKQMLAPRTSQSRENQANTPLCLFHECIKKEPNRSLVQRSNSWTHLGSSKLLRTANAKIKFWLFAFRINPVGTQR